MSGGGRSAYAPDRQGPLAEGTNGNMLYVYAGHEQRCPEARSALNMLPDCQARAIAEGRMNVGEHAVRYAGTMMFRGAVS
jgi:hypothetical protein